MGTCENVLDEMMMGVDHGGECTDRWDGFQFNASLIFMGVDKQTRTFALVSTNISLATIEN